LLGYFVKFYLGFHLEGIVEDHYITFDLFVSSVNGLIATDPGYLKGGVFWDLIVLDEGTSDTNIKVDLD